MSVTYFINTKQISMNDNTSTLLVEDLRQKEVSPGRDLLIVRAQRLEFDDFRSPHATPKMVLFQELMKLGYRDLCDQVYEGRYD